jgi:hypothetical protein
VACFDIDVFMLDVVFIQPFQGFLAGAASAVAVNFDHCIPPCTMFFNSIITAGVIEFIIFVIYALF